MSLNSKIIKEFRIRNMEGSPTEKEAIYIRSCKRFVGGPCNMCEINKLVQKYITHVT